jgi:flagellar basal-body rod modification protein FlgD
VDALEALKLEEPQKTEARSALDQTGLDQDAFLKIFLAQLEHQDPLNPQDATELGAQLAQFSQLEQSVRMTGELEGVNSRLDQLIESSGAKSGFSLDPVTLIGREVDFGLRLPGAGESEPLRIELDEASEMLRVEARDREGTAIGHAEIVGSDENGEQVDLPAGTYQLVFDNGQPLLIVPDGGESNITFFTSREGSRQIDRGAPPTSFEPGMTYQFSVVAEGLSRGAYVPRTNTAGTVDAVHMVNGQPVLLVAGQEVDPSQVLRIR